MGFKRTSLVRDKKKRIQCPNCSKYLFTYYSNQVKRVHIKHCNYCSFNWKVEIGVSKIGAKKYEVSIKFTNLENKDTQLVVSEAAFDDQIRLIYNQSS